MASSRIAAALALTVIMLFISVISFYPVDLDFAFPNFIKKGGLRGSSSNRFGNGEFSCRVLNKTTNSTVLVPSKIRIFFAFVALGDESERSEMMLKNIQFLKESQDSISSRYEMHCAVFAFGERAKRPKWSIEFEGFEDFCVLHPFKGLSFAYFLKILSPQFLGNGNYDYLILNMDDVILYEPEADFKLRPYLDIVVDYDLMVASPAVIKSVHKILCPARQRNAIGRYLTGIEIQSIMVRMDAWKCMWSLVDTEYPSGWGIDFWYWDFCVIRNNFSETSIGLIDIFTCKHAALPSTNSKGISPGALVSRQAKNWKEKRGIELLSKPFEFKQLMLAKI